LLLQHNLYIFISMRVSMKFSISYFLFLSCLIVLTPLYAATETLTTYYPSPSGNYKKIQTNYMQITPSTLSDIEAMYKCSYFPASGLPPCPAGIVFYNTDEHTLYVSDSTHWRSVYSTCVPLRPCSEILNCSTDDCGNPCGNCPGNLKCSSSTPTSPGTCS
jgi:hypothetical protein